MTDPLAPLDDVPPPFGDRVRWSALLAVLAMVLALMVIWSVWRLIA